MEVLSTKDLCNILKIGKTTAYNLLKSKKIKSIKIGRIYKIPKKSLIDYISSCNCNKNELLSHSNDVLLN